MSDIKKFKGLPLDAEVKLVINGTHYKDLQHSFITELNRDETKETVGAILDNLVAGKVSSPKERVLYPLYMLICTIEKNAQDQNLIQEYDIPEPNEDSL